MIRLLLICCAATTATRRAAFPLDEPIEERGVAEAKELAATLRRPDRALTSPTLRARQTAEALHLDAVNDEALRDLDCGTWAGATPAEIQERDPEGLAAWLRDPSATPHSGEAISDLIERTRLFLQHRSSESGWLTAVTHASVIRAAIMVALDAPFPAFWKIDIAPLTRVSLSADGERWRLRSMEN